VELDAAQLSQAGAVHQWPKLKVAQLLEAVPRRLALVLHEGEVPCLGHPTQVIDRQPRVIRRRGLLTAEELLSMVVPVQRIVEAIVRRELQLVEAWNGLAGTLRPRRRPGGCCSGACGGAHVRWEEGPVDAPIEDAGRSRSPMRSGG
jgi:hypothetical protein